MNEEILFNYVLSQMQGSELEVKNNIATFYKQGVDIARGEIYHHGQSHGVTYYMNAAEGTYAKFHGKKAKLLFDSAVLVSHITTPDYNEDDPYATF
jgi:hypothetical protein